MGYGSYMLQVFYYEPKKITLLNFSCIAHFCC